MSQNKLATYKLLLKPGIIRSNTLMAVAGYFLAAGLHPRLLEFMGLFSGVALVIASACVFNNYFDRDIDKNMDRTKNRPFAQGTVDVGLALGIATILLLLGAASLAIFVNLLSLILTMTAFITYVFVYTPIKKRSVHGTLVGTIPGALPPAAGYVAYTNQLDIAPILLGLILVFWQMPHFFAIALFRMSEYKKAKIPVLPIKHGTKLTKQFILAYIVGLIFACTALTLFGYAGWSFLAIITILNLTWLYKGLANYNKLDDKAWGKKMFLFSLVIITSLSVTIALGTILP